MVLLLNIWAHPFEIKRNREHVHEALTSVPVFWFRYIFFLDGSASIILQFTAD